MPSVRDYFSSVKRYLGLPTSTSKKRSRPVSPIRSPISRPSSRNENVDLQDVAPFAYTVPSSSSPPAPLQPTRRRHSSLGAPNTNVPQVRRFRPPSSNAVPDNEVRARASLSTHCAMSFAAVVQELAPIPAIGSLVGCLNLVFQAVEKAKVNKEQWLLLRGRCVMVTRIAGAQVTNYGGADYPGLHDSAELLQNTITNVGQRAAYYNEMQEFLALFQYQNISEEIREHFAQLDVCLRMFSYTAKVAQMQWIGEFSAVQQAELRELEEMKKLMISLNENLDITGRGNEQDIAIVSRMDEKLQKVLEDNSKIIKNQGTTTTITHRSTPSFDTVTGNMSAQDMFLCLVQRGCADLSLSVDPDRYSESAIASGGFGDVWQAWMKDGTKNGILVAVKCLRLHMILEGDKKGMKRAMRELYNWSKAQHENIQQLLGIVIFQGKLGMVSVWRPNGNLQQYIKSNPGVERHPLCVQLTKGVAYLHEIGMVHGDLKASWFWINILVCPNGIVKISDFDYSILSESTLRFSETSKAGGGTVRWMAPELILLEEGEDAPPPTRNAKTDVYALGMTMLETISGKVPYHQYQHDRTIILALERKQFPKCPEELSGSDERATRMWALLLQCWDHNPKARPDAPSVLASLQSIAP